jgi:ubiquitin carboxyl-terminal hydrolase 4/11/15
MEEKDNNDVEMKDSTKQETEEEKEKMNVDEDEQTKTSNKRSVFSLEGAKEPLSLYTRRVMDISKIDKYLKPNSTRGRCGGRNLGNTCFMNSSIACLSNTTELTYYFLNGDYKKDINEENTLGLRGELAKSWGNLMHQYWVESTHVGDPSEFKYTIGRKAKIFRGYAQQDSNEFMSFFLDYINEDLNRVTKKEYIELKEKGENETDLECSKRFWDCNLRRNDSIITDLFCGQYKSTITCPECGNINITFDPFDTINLPLLTQKKRRSYYNNEFEEFQFFYVPKYSFRNPYCVCVKEISSSESFNNLIERIKKEKDFVYHDKLDKLLIIDMYRNDHIGNPNPRTEIRSYNYKDEYIISYNYNEEEDEIKMEAYFYENTNESKSLYPRMIFLTKNSTLDDLRKDIYFNIRKYILSPFLKENEKKDSLSLEIEKYLEDKNLELNEDKLKELIEKEYQEVFKKDKEDEKEKKDKEKGEKEPKSGEVSSPEDVEMKDGNKEEKKGETEEKTKGGENKTCLEKFIDDLPFKVKIQKVKSGRNDASFINKEHFFKLSDKFKQIYDFTSFEDTLDKTNKDLNSYEIVVTFNPESKYINKNTFNLDFFEKYSLFFKKKKEEKKEEEEDELSGKMTLEKCLKKFVKEEKLEEGDEWYCSKCKNHVLATKKMELFYLPKILIICFKRFIKDSSYSWDKNDDEVDFPINNMDLKEFVIGPDKEHSKYDLFAVSQHYGSTGGGHYTAICKNDGKWFSYNDSSCHETSENNIVTSAAYVLFYRRQTD